VTAEIDLKPGWRAGLPVGDMIEIFGEVTDAVIAPVRMFDRRCA